MLATYVALFTDAIDLYLLTVQVCDHSKMDLRRDQKYSLQFHEYSRRLIERIKATKKRYLVVSIV